MAVAAVPCMILWPGNPQNEMLLWLQSRAHFCHIANDLLSWMVRWLSQSAHRRKHSKIYIIKLPINRPCRPILVFHTPWSPPGGRWIFMNNHCKLILRGDQLCTRSPKKLDPALERLVFIRACLRLHPKIKKKTNLGYTLRSLKVDLYFRSTFNEIYFQRDLLLTRSTFKEDI